MSYIQQTLLKDETVILDTKPHWVIYLSAIIICVAGFALWWVLNHFGLSRNVDGSYSIMMWSVWLCFVVAVIQLFRMWMKHFFSDYAITNKRAVMKTGWIARDAFETFLERIEGTRVDQSILGRILGYGTLIVIGTGGTPDAFPFVPNVLRFRHSLQQAMDQAMQRKTDS